jgi:hypothetical protein
LIFSFNPGTILEINNLQLFSKDNIYNVSEKDLLIHSKNTFFNNNGAQNQIIFTAKNNEVLDLKLNQVFTNIDKIIFSMKFDKLNLINKNCQ